MMVKVHKQVLDPRRLDHNNRIVLELPRGSRILHAGAQNNNMIVWYEFDVENENEVASQYFWVEPTGQAFERHQVFVGTIVLNGGSLIFHVYTTEDD